MLEIFSDLHGCDPAALVLDSETREGAVGYRSFDCTLCGARVVRQFDASSAFERGPALTRWTEVVAALGGSGHDDVPRDDLADMIDAWAHRSVA